MQLFRLSGQSRIVLESKLTKKMYTWKVGTLQELERFRMPLALTTSSALGGDDDDYDNSSRRCVLSGLPVL